MSTYYVDPQAGSNTAPYDTWAKAATSLRTVEALLHANDTAYCRGSETITNASGAITMTQGGSNAGAGAIRIIGCDAAGTPNAGQYVISGAVGDLPTYLYYSGVASKYYRYFENITFSGAITYTFQMGPSNYWWRFTKCIFENATNAGLDGGTAGYTVFWQCIFRNCSNNGVHDGATGLNTFMFCKFTNNSLRGINTQGDFGLLYGCVLEGNSGSNLYIDKFTWTAINCVFATSPAGSGIRITNGSASQRLFFNRSTGNNQYGIEVDVLNADNSWENYNGFHGNIAGVRNNITAGVNSVNLTTAGYVDAGNDNYALADDAEERRAEVSLDWDDTDYTKTYPTMGLSPNDPTSSGGGGSKSRFNDKVGIKRGIK